MGSHVGSAEPIPGVSLVQGLCWFLVGWGGDQGTARQRDRSRTKPQASRLLPGGQ